MVILTREGRVFAPMNLSFDHYELIRLLGEGSEANVYLARDPTTKNLVALRVLKEEHWSIAASFLGRARAMAELGHPGIVRVLESSREDELPPFTALSFAPNGTLRDKLKDGAFHELKDTLALMIKVADACHFAHQHGVLHGDIAPENILFNGQNEPVLADFGGGPIPGGFTGGHREFIAPEKLAGSADTVPVDIFSLGAVLSFLIDRSSEKKSLTKKRARVVARLATSTAPMQRHASAQVFADELRRVLADDPLTHPQPKWWERAALRARRGRSLIARAALASALLLAVEGGMLLFWRHREDEQARAALKTYREVAIEYADRALSRLQGLVESARLAARDPEIVASLARAADEKPRAELARYHEVAQLRGANSLALFDWSGNLLLRYPSSGAVEGKNFAFRDYYEGLHALIPEATHAPHARNAVYVSRAYRGEASCGVELSCVVPVLSENNSTLGFMLSSVHAQHTMERIGVSRLDGAKGLRLQSALFAERSRDRPGQPSCGRREVALGRFIALVHPDLFRAEEYPVDQELSAKLDNLTYHGDPGNQLESWERDPLVLESFRDPVTHAAQMGAFAPVGKTRIVVAVFADREQVGPWHNLPLSMFAWALVGHLLFLSAGLWAASRSKSKQV